MSDIILSSDTFVPDLSEPNYVDGGLNFLQLVQRLRQEAGVSGSGPTTIVNQTGEYKRLVDWTSTAWMDIQNERRDWFFMQQAISFNATSGARSYTASDAGIASFGNYKIDSFRQYRASIGVGSEVDLVFMPYERFRQYYLRNASRTLTGMPVHFTIDPSKNFLLGPIPNDTFTVNGEGYAMPTEMTLDGDRPTMPAQFHMAIVWRALRDYGTYEAAQECIARGTSRYDSLMSLLFDDQLPDIDLGGPLL